MHVDAGMCMQVFVYVCMCMPAHMCPCACECRRVRTGICMHMCMSANVFLAHYEDVQKGNDYE